MMPNTLKRTSVVALKAFLKKRRPKRGRALTAVSLFSGVGISDMGYELAGFRFQVQVEQDEARASIGTKNFPHAKWIAKSVGDAASEIVSAYREKTTQQLDLLVATPPCQGMSSSNPSRGKRQTQSARLNDEKNTLIMGLVPVAVALRPRIIVSENVRQILTHTVSRGGRERRVLDILAEMLPDYAFFETCVNVADYGIPQIRRRALVVGVRNDEPWLPSLAEKQLLPWPKATHGESPDKNRRPWLCLREWFQSMEYTALSSRTPDSAKDGHPLHFVPNYNPDRFLLVSSIPPHSGRSAYENSTCPDCGTQGIPIGLAKCPACGRPMRNRPIVLAEGEPRLIKGFDSSYRRMRSDQPASTVTTNSSHVGSDNKIHPWENRVLSILECADLQTVPRFFNWSPALDKRRVYLVRNVIGEAFPTYFTYLHGRVLRGLLRDRFPSPSLCSTEP
jgi:DNA (cytosine-5)-methyltransferase 1